MAVCYNNLWKLLIDKNMNRTELKEAAGISFNVMARMGKNETVSFESIEKICAVLNCNIGDVVEFVQEPTEVVEKKPMTIELFAEHTEEITHSNLSLAKNNLKSLQKLVISANSG